MDRKRLLGMAAAALMVLPMTFVSCNKDDDDDNQEVKVEKVELNIHEQDIFVGENFTLEATVLPKNAKNKKVTWTSGDEKIATVDNGEVKVIAVGTTYIYVKTSEGGFKDSCKVIARGNIEFADAKFLAALVADKNINTDGDDGISRKEAAAAEAMDISAKNITSIDGIEYFTNLKELDCSENKSLETIDLSKLTNLTSLLCPYTGISKLDLSNNKALTYLDCSNNAIDSLDIRQNSALTSFICGSQKDAIKLILTIDQYNELWNKVKTDGDNTNVSLIMNIFDNVEFQSVRFDSNLKDGQSASIAVMKKSLNLFLYDTAKEDNLSFIESSLLEQLTWASSDENVATISSEIVQDDNKYYYTQVKVSLKAVGETEISATDGQGNKISFKLAVTE